jgi:predicted nuclease of restriction endonuclease-like (RecB) superfamily
MNFEILIATIQNAHDATLQSAVKSVNVLLTVRNWLIGYYIVSFEQNGVDRAKYGNKVITTLAKQLNIKGLAETNLKQSRKFYLTYPQIRQTISDIFLSQIGQMPSDEFATIANTSETESKLNEISYFKTIINKISFSHFVELIKIDNTTKRNFYEVLIIKTLPNVESLKHQIATLSYERFGLSNDSPVALEAIESKIIPACAADAIKSVYFFDFLNLPSNHLVQESDLEQALIDHLQKFMIELGNGFCFEARQKRILIDDNYYFTDLVFYHRILKCHVIVELKIDQFKHEHLSQLNTYVSYFRAEVMQKDDNPPIGILLCTEKGNKLVEYALSGMDEKLFVSKYLLNLPSKEALQNFIENQMKKQLF